MKNSPLTTGLLAGMTLVSTGTAVFYKIQASHYEAGWFEALGQMETSMGTLCTVRTPEAASVLPARREETISTPQDLLIEELLAQIDEKDRQIENLENTSVQPRRSPIPSFEDRRKQLEELKTTNPEEYEKIIQRREELRNRIQETFATKAADLLDRDTANLSKQEKVRYENMLNLMDETWQLTEQLTSPETPPEERREIRQELSEKTKELRPLLQEERETRFIELGLSSGYSEIEAAEFAKYINTTIRATSLPGGGGRG
ncbi:MAG: hypothetical protein WC047_07995, partial [Kiritimatiellales bacterium]